MPTSSSGNLGTQQENTKEVATTSGKKTPATPEATAEVTPKDAPVVIDGTHATPDEGGADAAEPTARTVEAPAFEDILSDGRVRIDAIDDQILELIVRRIEVANTLLSAKHVRRIDPRDKRRQAEIFNRLNGSVTDLTADNGVNLNEHQIRELYELFIRFGIESFRKNVIDGRHQR